MNGETLWSRLAGLALIVEGCEYDRLLDTFTGRTAVATAELLGQQGTVFPSHHGGFLGGEFGYAGQPEAFARRLGEVLDQD
jgi:hypothetical protein